MKKGERSCWCTVPGGYPRGNAFLWYSTIIPFVSVLAYLPTVRAEQHEEHSRYCTINLPTTQRPSSLMAPNQLVFSILLDSAHATAMRFRSFILRASVPLRSKPHIGSRICCCSLPEKSYLELRYGSLAGPGWHCMRDIPC